MGPERRSTFGHRDLHNPCGSGGFHECRAANRREGSTGRSASELVRFWVAVAEQLFTEVVGIQHSRGAARDIPVASLHQSIQNV